MVSTAVAGLPSEPRRRWDCSRAQIRWFHPASTSGIVVNRNRDGFGRHCRQRQTHTVRRDGGVIGSRLSSRYRRWWAKFTVTAPALPPARLTRIVAVGPLSFTLQVAALNCSEPGVRDRISVHVEDRIES